MTTATNARSAFVERARTLPRNMTGALAIGGWLMMLGGLACLIGGAADLAAGRSPLIDLRLSGAALVLGLVLTAWASNRVHKQFLAAAAAAGFTADEIHEIENEADRLDEEED